MKIYVSEKENIDLSKKCYLTFSTKDEQTADWNVLAQSLEQHDKELLEKFAEQIMWKLTYKEIYNGIFENTSWEEGFNKGINTTKGVIEKLLKERDVE